MTSVKFGKSKERTRQSSYRTDERDGGEYRKGTGEVDRKYESGYSKDFVCRQILRENNFRVVTKK